MRIPKRRPPGVPGLGRPRKFTDTHVKQAQQLLRNTDLTVVQVAAKMKVSLSTIQTYCGSKAAQKLLQAQEISKGLPRGKTFKRPRAA